MEGTNPPFPPDFVTSTRLPDDRSCSTEEKPDNWPLLPPNYVSLRELRERRLKEEQEREGRREGGKASEGADRRHPSYITVRELEEELLREAEEKERKGKGKRSDERDEGKAKVEKKENVGKEEGKKKKLKELRLQEKDKKCDDSSKIEKKINKFSHRVRNLSSKEADRVCHVKSGWVWEPKLLVAGSSMISAENAGVSHEVLTVSSDQNGASTPQINPKKKWKDKKNKKKKNWKRDSGKDKHEPVLNVEQPMEMTLSQNRINTVRKVKGENMNINEASSQLVPDIVEAKRLNGRRSRRIKGHKGGDRTKNKEVNLSEEKKGFDGVKEATGTEIESGTDLKGKGKMVNFSESIDRISSHEEAKEIEVKNSEVIKRNLTAGSRGRGHPRAGRRFSVRPSERLSGGGDGFVWVPKNGS